MIPKFFRRQHAVLSFIFWFIKLGLLFIGIILIAFSTLVLKDILPENIRIIAWLPFVGLLWAGWFIQDIVRHGVKKRVYKTNVSQERQAKAFEELFGKEVKKREEN